MAVDTTNANFSSPDVDPLRNFRFLVKINAEPNVTFPSGWSTTLGFTSVEGLSMTINAIPYREGGYNTTVHQIPGQASFSPLTLSRGVLLGTDQYYQWTRALFSTLQGAGTGTPGGNFRANVLINVLDHPVSNASTPVTKIQFKVHNAWITSLAYSGLNAGDNAVFVEQMTLAHEGWEASWAPSTPGADAAADLA